MQENCEPKRPSILDELEELKKELLTALELRAHTEKSFEELIKEIEQSYDKSRKAKLGGTVATVTGSTMGIAGFGLAFVTLGASLPLLVAGAIIAGAGGTVIAGADIGYAIVSKRRMKELEILWQKDTEQTEHVADKIKQCGNHPDMFGELWKSKVQGMASTSKTLAVSAFDASRIGSTAARASLRIAAIAASAVGTVVVAFDTLLIPIDIATMAKAAFDIHKYEGGKGVSNSKIAKKARDNLHVIREHTKNMQDALSALQ